MTSRVVLSAALLLCVFCSTGFAAPTFTYPTDPSTCKGESTEYSNYNALELLGQYGVVTGMAEAAGISADCMAIAQSQLGSCLSDLSIQEGCCSTDCGANLKAPEVGPCLDKVLTGLCMMLDQGLEIQSLAKSMFNTARRCVTGVMVDCKTLGKPMASPPPSPMPSSPKPPSPQPPAAKSPSPKPVTPVTNTTNTTKAPPATKKKKSPPPKKVVKASPPKKKTSKSGRRQQRHHL